MYKARKIVASARNLAYMIRNPKDFWSGALYILFGATALFAGRDYGMGTALRMGPAYFPSTLAGMLIVVGATSVVRSFFAQGPPIGGFAIRQVAIVVGAVVLFGAIIRGAGLAVALPLLAIISASASARFRWVPSIVMAAGLTVFCVLVFLRGLGVPLPLIGRWFAG
jgi:Tripartite tricarboxylate transporter TctB family